MSRFLTKMMLLMTAALVIVLPTPAKAESTLRADVKFKVGDKLISDNGQYTFEITRNERFLEWCQCTDVRLELNITTANKNIWHVGSFSCRPDSEPYLVLQANGDLCLYSQTPKQKAAGELILHWHSSETREVEKSKRVVMQDDGNLCVYWKESAPIWWSQKDEGVGDFVGFHRKVQ